MKRAAQHKEDYRREYKTATLPGVCNDYKLSITIKLRQFFFFNSDCHNKNITNEISASIFNQVVVMVTSQMKAATNITQLMALGGIVWNGSAMGGL